MSDEYDTGVKALTTSPTTTTVHPHYEGCNIGSWIGFKHNNYLVEQAVLAHFRAASLSSRRLYEEAGLGLDLVGLDTRIVSALHLDDRVSATVTPTTEPGDDRLRFAVALTVDRDGAPVKAVTSRVEVQLRVDDQYPAGGVPDPLAPFAVERIGGGRRGRSGTVAALPMARGTGADDDEVLSGLVAGRNAVGWKWRIPYFYVHYSRRLQMSGYLRVMEEVVDRFLAERGISIRTLLEERSWIPAATHSRIALLDEAHMEDDLYTVYAVEELYKDLLYRSRMETYVLRGGAPVLTSAGEITHGYAVIEGRADWRLVGFDERVRDAFLGRAA